jgi:hypothetical protein
MDEILRLKPPDRPGDCIDSNSVAQDRGANLDHRTIEMCGLDGVAIKQHMHTPERLGPYGGVTLSI